MKMVTKNKIGMDLGGDCPINCGFEGEACDWIGCYKDCPVYLESD